MEHNPSWLVRTIEAMGAVQFAVSQFCFFVGVIFLVMAVPQWLAGQPATFASPWIMLASALFTSGAVVWMGLSEQREWRRKRLLEKRQQG